MKTVRRTVANVFGVAIGCLVVYVVVEGASSALLLAWDLAFKTTRGLRSGKHVQFDERLGWIGTPNTHRVDFYGPGHDLTIDERSLRVTAPRDPSDDVTVLCSGDSFTFGVGVGDEETWCYQLGAHKEGVATLNTGEPGYGLGQVYLKAQRLADEVDWDVQVFAMIADDVRRTSSSEFIGRYKPRFVLDDEQLVLEQDHVTESSPIYAWVRANKRVFSGLRVLELSDRLRYKLSGPPPPPPSVEETTRLIGAIFEAVSKMNAERGRRAVFVFLPSGPDIDAPTTAWRPRIRAECARRGLVFVDLVEPFQRIPTSEQLGMFEDVTRHYNARGNAWVADRVFEIVRTATTAD